MVEDALPEPWIGALVPATCRMVFLALNPGRAHLRFQGREGVFADEIRTTYRRYSAWAASWPYLREPWISSVGRNRHHESRLRFMKNWYDDATLSSDAMVGFELYPWHSTKVTATMRPDPGLIREWVWEPVADLDAPVFAFGAPWLDLLEHGLQLPVVDRLGAHGRPYGSAVASRAITLFETPTGTLVIAEKHAGSAGPPSAGETSLLRAALD